MTYGNCIFQTRQMSVSQQMWQPDEHMNSQRLWPHMQDLHRIKPDRIQSPTPNRDAFSNRYPLGQRKSIFSNEAMLEISTTHQGRDPWP